jgi:hypothetical protein
LAEVNVSDEHEKPDGAGVSEDEHKGFFETIPRGTITRVLILLAALAGIVVLQRKTGAIAGCMSQAFMAPAPRSDVRADKAEGPRIRGQVLLPTDARNDE